MEDILPNMSSRRQRELFVHPLSASSGSEASSSTSASEESASTSALRAAFNQARTDFNQSNAVYLTLCASSSFRASFQELVAQEGFDITFLLVTEKMPLQNIREDLQAEIIHHVASLCFDKFAKSINGTNAAYITFLKENVARFATFFENSLSEHDFLTSLIHHHVVIQDLPTDFTSIMAKIDTKLDHLPIDRDLMVKILRSFAFHYCFNLRNEDPSVNLALKENEQDIQCTKVRFMEANALLEDHAQFDAQFQRALQLNVPLDHITAISLSYRPFDQKIAMMTQLVEAAERNAPPPPTAQDAAQDAAAAAAAAAAAFEAGDMAAAAAATSAAYAAAAAAVRAIDAGDNPEAVAQAEAAAAEATSLFHHRQNEEHEYILEFPSASDPQRAAAGAARAPPPHTPAPAPLNDED